MKNDAMFIDEKPIAAPMRCILGIKRNESMKFDMSAADDDIINILVFLTL